MTKIKLICVTNEFGKPRALVYYEHNGCLVAEWLDGTRHTLSDPDLHRVWYALRQCRLSKYALKGGK